MAFRVRPRLAFAFAILSAGCAGLLALDDVTYDGGAVDSGVEADASPESSTLPPSDGGGTDAGSDAQLTCDANLDLDPSNCGRCGRSCGNGQGCNNRICEPALVVDGLTQIGPITGDATRLYFVGDSEIKTCTKTLVCAPTTFAPALSQPFGIAAAPNLVVWTTGLSGELWSCPTTGCISALPLDRAPGSNPFAVALSTDGTQVFWSRLSASDAGPAGVLRCSTSACSPQLVNTAASPMAVAYAPGLLVWADQAPGLIRACDPSNCSPLSGATATQAKSVAVDAQRIYWAEGTKIGICDRADCNGTTRRINASSSPWRIAIDDAYVYWTVPGTGTLAKNGLVEYCEKASCTVSKRLVIQQSHPTDLYADGVDVYFTDDQDLTIRRVPRP